MYVVTMSIFVDKYIYNEDHELKETMESHDQKIRMNSSSTISTKVNGVDQDHDDVVDDDDDVPLPGFRFHPTDEELVGFYLRRKVERKPISIELIKQIDIYKYDPWDLPKASNVGDKEWYFFCKRGRKYRNSIRPNRVTGSGFWKATGIDRPIYSGGGEGRDCIGLKKSLVYYRGSAGKGTKTDWMMHEFRLPVDHHEKSIKHLDVKVKPVSQEDAEVWTLCRIFKRNVSYRKCMPDWKELSGKRVNKTVDSSSKTCSNTLDSSEERQKYISFNSAAAPVINMQSSINDMKPFTSNADQINRNELFVNGSFSQDAQSITSYNNNSIPSSTDLPDFFIKQADWDELRSVVDMHNNVMGLDFNQF